MKAVVYHEYGRPNVLRLEEVNAAIVMDDKVLGTSTHRIRQVNQRD